MLRMRNLDTTALQADEVSRVIIWILCIHQEKLRMCCFVVMMFTQLLLQAKECIKLYTTFMAVLADYEIQKSKQWAQVSKL
jgi:hypothetical protein